MGNTTPTIRQWNEEIFQLLYQYYQGVSNMSNSGTFNIKGVLEYIRKILFNKKFNIPNEDAMKSSVLEGMTTFKQDSYNAFKAFKDSIEMYIEIAMYSIQLLDKKEIVSNSLSIGKCDKRLLEALQERCRLSENETRKLGYFIEEGETWRNIWHHNTPPREDTDIHKKGCQIALEYLFAVSAICRRIEMARGGIRFTADITCSLDFQNGGQNRSFTYVDVNTPLQIEGKAGEYTLRITINDKNGAKTFTREGIIKSNQYNDEVLQKDSRAHKKNKIRIAPIFNLGNDALDGIPWKRGNYQGAVDTEGKPHGIGTYIQENKKFGGRFQHGEPQGIFKVSCPEFEYKGTIIANNNSPWDLCEGEMEMSNSKELKFIGRFKNFCCVEGKLLIANKISYEGTFKIINGQATVSGYGTLYLPDHLIYRGEVFNGAPHGRGCLVDEQALEVTYTDWYMGESIADELKELHIKGNEPVKLYDNNNFLCDITLKGICLNYSVEKLNLVIENDGGDTLSYSNNLLQKDCWNYNILYTLEVYESENGKYGLKNKKGDIIISPFYDWIDIRFCNYTYTGLIFVRKNNKQGYIDRNNKVIIPIVYDHVGVFEDDEYLIAQLNNLFGVWDNKGNIIIDFIYEEINYISKEDGFKVKLNKKYGYINVKGEITIPIEYRHLDNGWYDGLLLAQNSDGKVGYLNKKNEAFFFNEYSSCSRFSEGLAFVKSKYDYQTPWPAEYKNKWGVINIKGEIKIPCIFDDDSYFDNGYADVVFHGVSIRISKNYPPRINIIKGENGLFGLKDEEGNVLTSFIYDKISELHGTYLLKVILNGLTGIIDYQGSILLKAEYNEIDFWGNNIYYALKNGTWTVIHKSKLQDTSMRFDRVQHTPYFSSNYFWGEKDKMWHLFKYCFTDMSFKKVLFDYQFVDSKKNTLNKMMLIKRDNKYGFINAQELEDTTPKTESIPCIYENATNFIDDFAFVNVDRKWGIINREGKMILNPQYDSIYIENIRSLGLCIIEKTGKYGAIYIRQKSCYIIVPCKFDIIKVIFSHTLKYYYLLTKYDSKYGALDTKGKMLKPCSYEKASDVEKALEMRM